MGGGGGGGWVVFDSSTIKKVLELTDRDYHEYRKLFRSLDYAKILKKVAVTNTAWRRKRDGELLDIPRGRLTKEAKAWFYFINSRLIPFKHVSTLYKDKAIFL